MKVLLINVSLRPNSETLLFPVGFGYIATAVERAGFKFEILDLDTLRISDKEVEEYIKATEYDVVALGCIVTGYKYVKKLAGMIKKYKPEVPIIVGNSVATSIPETLLTKTQVDIAVIGEGDITIVELLKALEHKTPIDEVNGIAYLKDDTLVLTPDRQIIPNLDDLPFINYELFDVETYIEKGKTNVTEPYPVPYDLLRVLPINTARGCLYNCTFCYHVFKHKKYRTRSIANLMEEMRYLVEKYNGNYFTFFDELSLFSRDQANAFADSLLEQPFKVYWAADCRAGLFNENDFDLAVKLQKAGCISLGYSLESADEEILKAMNKKITVDEFVVQTKVLKKAGITPVTSLVIGYPQETEETINETFDVCYKAGIYPSTGYLLPQPGTPMYDYAREHGMIPDEEEYLLRIGDRQDFTVNLTNIKQERIEELVHYHLQRISEKLKLGLDSDHLIKTGHYVQTKEEDGDNDNQ